MDALTPTRTTARPLDDVVMLPGFRHPDFATTRGILYAATIQAGHSEFIAASYAMNARRCAGPAVIGLAGAVAAMSGAMPAEILAA